MHTKETICLCWVLDVERRCMSWDFAGGKMPCEGVVSGYFLGGIIEGEKKKSIIKNRMFLRSMWGDDILIFNRE